MLNQVVTALVGWSCLAAAVPTASKFSRRGQFNQTNNFFNGGNGFDQLAQIAQLQQLQQLAEADLLAQVQSQLILSAELQAIKDNIRINTLRARFPQVVSGWLSVMYARATANWSAEHGSCDGNKCYRCPEPSRHQQPISTQPTPHRQRLPRPTTGHHGHRIPNIHHYRNRRLDHHGRDSYAHS